MLREGEPHKSQSSPGRGASPARLVCIAHNHRCPARQASARVGRRSEPHKRLPPRPHHHFAYQCPVPAACTPMEGAKQQANAETTGGKQSPGECVHNQHAHTKAGAGILHGTTLQLRHKAAHIKGPHVGGRRQNARHTYAQTSQSPQMNVHTKADAGGKHGNRQDHTT